MYAWLVNRRTQSQMRAVLAMLLALMLGPWLAGPTPPARAAEVDYSKPAARLQIILRSVYVYGDTDTIGGGELDLSASFRRCPPERTPCLSAAGSHALTQYDHTFNASTGDTATIDHILPTATDAVYGDYTIDEASGFTVYRGESYVVRVEIIEHDESDDDWMGVVNIPIHAENNWHLGTFTQDAYLEGSSERGYYSLHFEIIRTQLADLVPFSAPERFDTGHAADMVCVTVTNLGLDASPPFSVTFHLPAGSFPENVEAPADALSVHEKRRVCAHAELPTAGSNLTVGVSVDLRSDVPEMFEDNNAVVVPFAPRPGGTGDPGARPSPSPVPSRTPAAGKPDLVVTSIKLNGRVPDGKDDCKAGKNRVVVGVTNAGAGDAGSFTVHLVDDEGDALLATTTVDGLRSGQEREVRFDGVRLDKGRTTLSASADRARVVDESNDANNILRVTATCKDDD